MKKITYLIAILLLASASFYTSCTEDPAATPPTIMLNAAPGYTGTDVTVPANSTLKVGIIAKSTGAKLTNFKIIQTVNAVATTAKDTTFSSDTYNNDYTITAAPIAGVVKLTFKITAADGESAEASFTITTTAGPIKSYNQKILGSYDNTAYGSSFASADGSVYTLADAKINAAKVDWMYYYGVANLATLASPNDATVATIFTTAIGPSTWSVRNDTKFKIVTLPTGVTWDGITTDVEIISLATGITETKASALAVGKIIAFKTVTGKMGLIKIEAITGTGAGSITYSVKMQQ